MTKYPILRRFRVLANLQPELDDGYTVYEGR